MKTPDDLLSPRSTSFWCCLLALILTPCVAVHAKIPEPDAIFYGKAKHKGGTLLVPGSTGDIVVIARLNGVNIAQATIQALSSDFVLRVPMDDGQEPRLANTARGNDRVRVYFRSNVLDVEEETTLSVSNNGLVIPTERGLLNSGDLTVNGDLGGVPPDLATYAEWAASYGIDGAASSDDADNDGQTNLQEFVAGTDPTNSSDSFRILEVHRANGVSSIKFGPVLLSRQYSIWSSPDLSEGSWQRVGIIVPGTPADYRWFDHLSPENTPQLFYKLSVDVQ